MADLFDLAAAFFRELQREICTTLIELDGGGKDFGADAWQRPGGGGGLSRVLEGGAVFEKAGVNFSNVEGELPAELADHMPGGGRAFRAAGISLVLHPRSPMVPTTHANFRCIAKGDAMWFGGGADLTPYYFHREDAVHFHRTLAEACDRHKPVGDYDRFKAWCDEYFFLPHRGETRGVGGVFYDYLGSKGEPVAEVFAFVQDLGRAFLPAYVPIVRRRMGDAYGDLERTWQLQRRGRYVEFNLLYDRGTLFGLKTSGRIESILMSLPPLVRWDYDISPQPGSPEAALLAALRPTSWLER
ncbi:MAG TPA: oxygen-dependent coproporphyrinogen oxidase [Kofleriaceae bacterium]|nr:oxygen-dependent coproporphyrinogen oxidase [Kofleriaceae bacterium]